MAVRKLSMTIRAGPFGDKGCFCPLPTTAASYQMFPFVHVAVIFGPYSCPRLPAS